MSRQHPKVENAPGLIWRPYQGGWEARWQARTDLINKGFEPKSQRLWTGAEPTEAEAATISDTCNRLQDEMKIFSRGGLPAPVNPFDGTLRSLINCYQTDKDSPYQKNRFHVRRNRDGMLRRINERHGHEDLADIKARILLAWHQDWSQEGQKLATGSSFVGQMRSLFSFGATLLEDPQCERLCGVMHKMRFPGTKARQTSIMADQVDAVRKTAREHFSWPSISLGQAFQYEGTLRQKDVIGEVVPLSEPGVSAVIMHGKKWLRGLVWTEIDDQLILKHITSKKQKLTVIDLKLAPMVMEELQLLAGPEPLVVVDEITKRVIVNRHLLPASGPVIICDTTGLPWNASEYRRKWRLVATKAGVPKHVWNMDSRSGAISEAIQAGVPAEFVRQAATHSDLSQTMDYDRMQAESNAKSMKIRAESRNKPKTE